MSARVLVIDDDETACTVTTALLSRAGFYAVGVSTPIGATQLIRTNRIAMVVCDLHMPAMRGDSLARLFRGSAALRNIRLVLVSGAPPEELAKLVMGGGIDAVVHKSDVHRDLVPILRKLLVSNER